MRIRILLVALTVAFLAVGGRARGQGICLIEEKVRYADEARQFCFTIQRHNPCACTDWEGRRIVGRLRYGDLRIALSEAFISAGDQNRGWLKAQAEHFDNSPPPSKQPLTLNAQPGSKWGWFPFTGESPRPEDRFHAEIVPIGPWPAPPGWPPK